MRQSRFHCGIRCAHVEPNDEHCHEADQSVDPVHQEHDQNLDRSAGERRPTVTEARVPVLGFRVDMGTSSRSDRLILTSSFASCGICTIETVPEDDIVRAQRRVSSRRPRQVVRLTRSGGGGHRLVVDTLWEQLVQVVRLFNCRSVTTRFVGGTLCLNAEPLLPPTLNVKGLSEGKVSGGRRNEMR